MATTKPKKDPSTLRDTPYATELRRATVSFGDGGEARLEQLRRKNPDQIAIRFSWWKDGNMTNRPLDLTEPELLTLLECGIRESVFSEEFLSGLRRVLGQR